VSEAGQIERSGALAAMRQINPQRGNVALQNDDYCHAALSIFHDISNH
jgi:hypothetical protein